MKLDDILCRLVVVEVDVEVEGEVMDEEAEDMVEALVVDYHSLLLDHTQ